MDYKFCGRPDVSYHGENAWKPEFENFRRQFGILYWGAYAKRPDGTDDANFYVAYNMHWEPHMFGLPHLPKGARWRVICSTADPDVEDIPADGTSETLKNQMMLAVPPRGIMILESFADPDGEKEAKHSKGKKEKMEKASEICLDAPILKILPFTMKKAAVITTGNEVFYGRIKDGFTPVIEKKINEFGVEMVFHETFNDDDKKITKGCLDAVNAGVDIIFCTGGMSVDPDDKTPLAIKNTGADIISYGSPVLPGAMFLLSYYKKDDRIIPICGLPGCAMYNKRTILDLVLPRLLANDMITSDELASLGEGGFCLNCDVCTFPNCGFGKGW